MNNSHHKNLSKNKFYNNVTNNIISRNIPTSVFNHLTQVLLFPCQYTERLSHKMKENRSFWNFGTKAFEKGLEIIDYQYRIRISFFDFSLRI